jgi:hypothetical protein
MNHYDAAMVPGTKVRLSGKFLRNTGQIAGGEGQSVWTVQECSCPGCKDGYLVATNEPKDEESLKMFTEEELRDMPYLRMRHIARGNLSILGKLTVRDCP